MQNVLNTDSSVLCGRATDVPTAHEGNVQVQSTAKLKVDGAPVLLKDGIDKMPVVGCKTVPLSDSSGPLDVTCTTVKKVTAGEATKLNVGGKPVMLDTLAGDTDGKKNKVDQKFLAADAGQTKLRTV